MNNVLVMLSIEFIYCSPYYLFKKILMSIYFNKNLKRKMADQINCEKINMNCFGLLKIEYIYTKVLQFFQQRYGKS